MNEKSSSFIINLGRIILILAFYGLIIWYVATRWQEALVFVGLILTTILIIIIIRLLSGQSYSEVMYGDSLTQKKEETAIQKFQEHDIEDYKIDKAALKKPNILDEARQEPVKNMTDIMNLFPLDFLNEELQSYYKILDIYHEHYDAKINLNDFKIEGNIDYRLIYCFELPFADDDVLEVKKFINNHPEESLTVVREFLQERILNLEILIEDEISKHLKRTNPEIINIVNKRRPEEGWSRNDSPLTEAEVEILLRESEEADKIQALEAENKDNAEFGISWDYIELEGGDGFAIELDENGNPVKRRGDSEGWGGHPDRDFDTPWNT